MAIVAGDNVLVMGAILFGLVWFGFWADTNVIGRKTSGALWVIVGALILSNTGITPLASPVYDFIGQYFVPLSIPLLLYKANLRKIFRESGFIMILFFFACIATIAGTVLGYFILPLGDIGAKVAGVYTGGWIGGSMNFVAVSEAVEMTPGEFSAAIGANSPVSIMALLLLTTLPSIGIIRRFIPSKIIDENELAQVKSVTVSVTEHFKLSHISGAIALSFAICAVSFWIGDRFGLSQFSILIVTSVAVIIANIIPKTLSKIEGDFSLGMFLMYAFFAVVGASTDLSTFLNSALILFIYSILIIVIHMAFMLICAKVFKFDLADMIVASGAAIVGPAVTAAIATSRGWKDLVTPAIMCGIFGYVIGNFIGVAIYNLLS